MDLLDRLLGHDAWTTELLLTRCRELPEEALDQPFEVGNGTLRRTFAHMIGNVETWTALMDGQPVDLTPRPDSLTALTERHRQSYADFAALARGVRDEARWDETYLDTLDDPPRPKTFGGTLVHVTTHNMLHRGEALHMLARLGIGDLAEGDALSWEAAQRAV